MKVRARRDPVDFTGQTLAGEILMDSVGFIPEHVGQPRIAKHFPAAIFRPWFEPLWPVEAHHSWSIGAFSTAPHAPVTLSETASFSALYEHGEARRTRSVALLSSPHLL
jgi:hypothetical protein